MADCAERQDKTEGVRTSSYDFVVYDFCSFCTTGLKKIASYCSLHSFCLYLGGLEKNYFSAHLMYYE